MKNWLMLLVLLLATLYLVNLPASSPDKSPSASPMKIQDLSQIGVGGIQVGMPRSRVEARYGRNPATDVVYPEQHLAIRYERDRVKRVEGGTLTRENATVAEAGKRIDYYRQLLGTPDSDTVTSDESVPLRSLRYARFHLTIPYYPEAPVGLFILEQ